MQGRLEVPCKLQFYGAAKWVTKTSKLLQPKQKQNEILHERLNYAEETPNRRVKIDAMLFSPADNEIMTTSSKFLY